MKKSRSHAPRVLSGIMAGTFVLTGFGSNPVVANANVLSTDSYREIIEFETANRFSSDYGNRIENNQFSGYSGTGYLYLASGWGEVGFTVPQTGNYRITVVTKSDQHKQNWLYLDDNGAGVVYSDADEWGKTVFESKLDAGTHKVGVSSDWGYVALDYVIVELLDGQGTTATPTQTPQPTVEPTQTPDPTTEPTQTPEPTKAPEQTVAPTTSPSGEIIYEFESANHFSNDYGNKVANDAFSGYSGDGYVYLASGWADVEFDIPEDGEYKITIAATSDQYKENWLYLNDSSAGTLKTDADGWGMTTGTYQLKAGKHKFGVSTSWGYVALDYIKVEKVSATQTPTPTTAPTTAPTQTPTPTTAPTTAPTQTPTDVTISQESMYVKGKKLYDANGNEFIMRGINIPHAWYTDKTETSINAVADLGANCVRVVLADGYQWDKTSREEVQKIIDICKANKLVCVLEIHDYTGNNDPANLQQAVDYWIDLKDILNDNKNYVIVNIANEWLGTWDLGDTWANTYCEAIKRIRNAGIENVIMVDGSGYGQETKYLIRDCKKVRDADPLGNTMFSIHMYSVAGADASTVKSNIDNTLANDVCLCIGEFGDFQNGGDVDEQTIIDYSQEKSVGTIAWSWKGNGGTDITLDLSKDWEGKNLTDWGKYVFYSENGIYNTSRLAYYLTYPDGDNPGPAPTVAPVPTPTPAPTVAPDGEIPIDTDQLNVSEEEWFLSGDASDEVSTVSSMTELSNGGIRVNFDLKEEPYSYLTNYVKGLDLSANKTMNVVVRNNNQYAIQLQPIFKNGDLWEWEEFDKYQTVPAQSTVMLTFDLTKSTTRDEVNALLFRIQGSGSKIAGSVDFISLGYDLAEDEYEMEIAELNRPKTADFFSWRYPEASWVDSTVKAELTSEGTLSVDFADMTDSAASGIQTETRPGLGVGLDFSLYNSITCTITNNSDTDVHATLLLRSSADWTWQENAGVTADSEEGETIIPAGESVDVTYYLKDSTWKSKATGWAYTGEFEDADDVRAIGFKLYTGGEKASGNVEISNFQCNF